MIRSHNKNLKKQRCVSNKFLHDFNPGDDLRIHLIVYCCEVMQEEALTSFTLYDQYRTNTVHE